MSITKGQPDTLIEKVIKSGKFKVKSRDIVYLKDISIGDYVSAYSLKDAALCNKEVLDISSSYYDGEIIEVNINNIINSYISNHECLVRYRDRSNDYCVYIMRKGTAYRVGMSKMWHEDNGCGPYKRLSDEEGDELWILDTFDSRRKALLEEAKVSIRFRIPQTMFTFKESRGLWTQEELDYVWSQISNQEDAERVLISYGRDIKYPYFNRSKNHNSIKRPHKVNACNILRGSEMYVKDLKWVPINISRSSYTGNIYSLMVDGNYFTNTILT